MGTGDTYSLANLTYYELYCLGHGLHVVTIPPVAGALYAWGVLLTPALGVVLMAASTVIMAINARLLRLKK